MAAEPVQSLMIFPPLTDGQRDSLIQRLETALDQVAELCLRFVVQAHETPQRYARRDDGPEVDVLRELGDRLTDEVLGACLFAMLPEDFAGDHDAAMAEALRIRQEAGSVRPMPNGYRPPTGPLKINLKGGCAA